MNSYKYYQNKAATADPVLGQTPFGITKEITDHIGRILNGLPPSQEKTKAENEMFKILSTKGFIGKEDLCDLREFVLEATEADGNEPPSHYH